MGFCTPCRWGGITMGALWYLQGVSLTLKAAHSVPLNITVLLCILNHLKCALEPMFPAEMYILKVRKGISFRGAPQQHAKVQCSTGFLRVTSIQAPFFYIISFLDTLLLHLGLMSIVLKTNFWNAGMKNNSPGDSCAEESYFGPSLHVCVQTHGLSILELDRSSVHAARVLCYTHPHTQLLLNMLDTMRSYFNRFEFTEVKL